jgi:hypothetical protein
MPCLKWNKLNKINYIWWPYFFCLLSSILSATTLCWYNKQLKLRSLCGYHFHIFTTSTTQSGSIRLSISRDVPDPDTGKILTSGTIRYKFAGYLPDSTVIYSKIFCYNHETEKFTWCLQIVKHEQLLSVRCITTKLRHIFFVMAM